MRMRQKMLIVTNLVFCLVVTGCAAFMPKVGGGSTSRPGTRTESEEAPRPDPEDESAELHAAILAAIADYQSYAWDGEEMPVLDEAYRVRVVGDYLIIKETEETGDVWASTLLNVNLPLEELRGQSDDSHFQSAIFSIDGDEARNYWLSPSGVHCYDRGETVENWQFDDLVKGEASLVQFGSYAPCVRVGSQLFYCAPDGEVELLIDGIVGEHLRVNYSSVLFAVNNGELAEYSCGRSDSAITASPIAQNVTSAIPLGIDFAVIFSCTDGNTYLVQNRDYETCYELLYGDPDIAYRYCLGQEAPEFYWKEYQTLREAHFVDADGTEKRLSDQEVVQQLLDKYCSSL